MRKVKSILSLLMVFVMLLQCQVTAFAAVEDTGFIDVDSNAWYSEAVKYCVENDLMSGTAANTFSPNTSMSRVMLATVLHRMAGSPQITDTSGFSDVVQGTWYTNAVTWAVQNEIMSGYGNGLFGTNDSVTREQIATILWRYSGSPAVNETALPFFDTAAISSYAVSAVNWARSIGMIGGKPGNLFDSKGNVTRAEVAMILRNYLSAKQPEPETTPTPTSQPMPTPEQSITNISITVGSSTFSAKLCDNETAKEFAARLPITLRMSELNGNEKFFYLPERLPTASEQVGSINTGDLMLYGSDCLVLFYENFSTAYSYTRLGTIEDASGLAAALGNGSVEVTFAAVNPS